MTKAWSLKDLEELGPGAQAQLRAKGILPPEKPYRLHDRISFLNTAIGSNGEDFGYNPDSIWCGYFVEQWETPSKEVWVKYELPFPKDNNVTVVTRQKNVLKYED